MAACLRRQEDPKAAKKAAKKAKRANRSLRRKKAIKDEGLPEEDTLVVSNQTAGASAHKSVRCVA